MHYSPPWRLPRNGGHARCRPGMGISFLFALLIMLLAGSVDNFAQSCSNPACRTTFIMLNTGFNYAAGEVYGNDVFDSWWGIESDNDPNTTESRRASVMPPYSGWPTRANARWDWRDNITSDPVTGTTVYYTQFEACGGGLMNLNLSVIAPEGGQVSLNGSNLFMVAPGLTPTAYSSGVVVNQGINTLRVAVNNINGTAVALNLIGSVSTGANNLVARECGPFKNGISLRVFDDLDQNGDYDLGEPGVSGVEIAMSNPSGQSSAYSTGDGRVWFEVPVGTSTMTAYPQSPWMIISGTTHTVTLALGASAVGLKVAMTTCPTIQVLKYNDRNCNGKQDAGEEGLGGWTINFSTGQQVITQPNVITKVKVCNTTSVTVSEVIPNGTCWVQTQPGGVGTYTINIQPGVFIYKAYFGNSSTGTLCINKFNDLNGDGIRDGNEPGLPNWKFTVTSSTLNQEVVTDAAGIVCISITCGTYTVCEELQNGWCPTTPACRTVTVAACSVTNATFGNTQAGRICIHKFNDRNCNGVQEPGEEDLPNWTFTITNASVSVSVTTGTLGMACVTLPAGDYQVCEATKAGWAIATTACCPSLCTTVTITACETKVVTFGNASTGTICVFKYNDIDDDGNYDPTIDLPLNNWTIEILDATTLVPIVTGTTDPSGFVCFELPLGWYRVKEVQQLGWEATEPVPPVDTYLEQVTPCCSILNMFGNHEYHCDTLLCVHKYNDRNCNGVQEPGEEDISGWEFTLTDGGGNTITVTTGTLGVTCATVSAGSWTVCEVTKAGWAIATTACCPSLCTTVTISTCGVVTVTFANASTGTICVFKYKDVDGDGNYDPLIDTPLDNWTIEILDATTLVTIATGTTDPSGFVCFELPLGWYYVKEVQQSGWTQTEPVLPVDRYLEEVTPCCSILNIFGNEQNSVIPCVGSICITKYNDANCNGTQDPGEPLLPNWQFTITNGSTVIVVTTGVTGTTCATVTTGTWNVCETLQPGWVNTTLLCQSVTVTCGTGTVNLSFGNASTGTICIRKFNDVNCNGVQDAGEVLVPGWPFTVYTAGGTVVTTVTTDATGIICLPVTAGNYRVCEGTRPCWVNTTPACVNVTVFVCSTTTATFGNSSTGTLCILKFEDLNGNGVQDPGEGPLAGWQFNVPGVGIVTTNAAGMACVNVTCGTYTVCEILQAGWVNTTPLCQTATVTPCTTTLLPFGNRKICNGTICITKYNDINCNGVQDPGEATLPNWQFTITNGSTVIVVTTGVTGTTCATVTTGNWSVCETLQPGWVNTTPLCRPVTVTCGTGTVNLLFGNSSTGNLCIRKFNDVNCNGVQDAGEVLVPGWPFTVYTAGGAVVTTVTTDATGIICLPVTAGNYRVCEGTRPCWVNTTPACVNVVVPICGTTTAIFGNSSTGTLCILKFEDLNGNGVQDPGEGPLAGWQFTVPGVGTLTTNTAGMACAQVTCGTYTVCEVLQPGWVNTTPLCQNVNVVPCVSTILPFGNRKICNGTICITKYNDINCNGVQDPGEATLPNWQFTITNGSTVIVVTTGVTGTICATVTTGNWSVCETLQPGWVNTTPLCQPVTVTCGTGTVNLLFGNSSTGNLCIRKFNDVNCNGVQDPGEVLVPGWPFTISTTTGTVVATVTTDATGMICLPITAGNYRVCEGTRPCWVNTTPACVNITVQPCASANILFGNSSTGTLCILKFEDLNGNGVQDPGEGPLAGWQFNVPGVGIVTTNAAGMACVNVTCGTYTVCEVLQPGWVNTTPLCQMVTVAPCVTSNLIFGNRKICNGTICITKYNDVNCNGTQDPGEAGVPNWTFSISNGGVPLFVITDPTGTVCVPVTSSNWTVCEVLQPGWVNTTPICQPALITCGTATVNLSFGNSSTGTLCIRKFNDVNCNGVQDPGEGLVPGWPFTIYTTTGTAVATVTTDVNGRVCTPITSGNYIVCEGTRPCWVNTTPACVSVTISPCGVSNIVFGNSSTGTLCILKFEDLNGNGIQDPGEPALAGWQFTVPGVGIVTTNAAGMACVQVTCGTYTVCEILQPGWINTTPLCQIVNVAPCATTILPFGNKKQQCKARLCGTKYWERMQGGMPCNGIIDPNETGLPLWDIAITDMGTGITTIVTTDINGDWCIDVDAPATYVIAEIVKWGFMPTFPAGGSYTVTVNCGDTVRGLDFLNCACPQPPGGIQCKADSIHIVSNPANFHGNTVLVASPPPGPWPRNGVGPVPVPAPAVPGSVWIAPDFVFPDQPGLYIWHRYFCVCENIDSTIVRIRLCFKGVNTVTVILNGMILGTYNTYPGGQTCIDTAVVVGPGCHPLEFHVNKNLLNPPPQAGLSYEGSIVGPGLIQDSCCMCYRMHVSPNVPVTLKQNKPADGRSHEATPGVDNADDVDNAESEAVTGLSDHMNSVFDPSLMSMPNPANGATTVYYTLPRPLDVQLDLYNSVGRHVLNLINGPQPEGRHSVPLDMAEVPSGFYHLRLTAGGRVYTLRLINNK